MGGGMSGLNFQKGVIRRIPDYVHLMRVVVEDFPMELNSSFLHICRKTDCKPPEGKTRNNDYLSSEEIPSVDIPGPVEIACAAAAPRRWIMCLEVRVLSVFVFFSYHTRSRRDQCE